MNRANNGSLVVKFEHPKKNEVLVIAQRTPYSKYNVRYYFRDIDESISFGKFDTIKDLYCYLRDNKKVSQWFLINILDEFKFTTF